MLRTRFRSLASLLALNKPSYVVVSAVYAVCCTYCNLSLNSKLAGPTDARQILSSISEISRTASRRARLRLATAEHASTHSPRSRDRVSIVSVCYCPPPSCFGPTPLSVARPEWKFPQLGVAAPHLSVRAASCSCDLRISAFPATPVRVASSMLCPPGHVPTGSLRMPCDRTPDSASRYRCCRTLISASSSHA